jgi:HD-GYP domain-containing protein (c-di-GMP phosphodiesterase class II)
MEMEQPQRCSNTSGTLLQRANSLESLLLRLTYRPGEEYHPLPHEDDTEPALLLDVLSSLLRSLADKDLELYQHSLRVHALVAYLVANLDLPPQTAAAIELAGLFHDIGKLSLPCELLHKNAPLSTQEFQEIQKHCYRGTWLLLQHRQLKLAALSVFHHHERWNGRGYPCGLQGLSIPLGARLISIADAYDVMTHPRAYHPCPHTCSEALEELAQCAGTQFDPNLVTHFCLLAPSMEQALRLHIAL